MSYDEFIDDFEVDIRRFAAQKMVINNGRGDENNG